MRQPNFSHFRSKKTLVLGLGLHGGGAGTVRLLAEQGARLTVTDLRSKSELYPSLKALKNIKGITYILGRHRKKDILAADLIIKNPGVRPDSPYLGLARKNNIPVTTDIGIFFNYAPATIIGVTGTRGKSTTAYLIWKFLQKRRSARTGRGLAQKSRVYLGGNIRKSVLEFLSNTRKGDIVVLELSSFQLADLAQEKKSPQIAVFTNLYQDHLNWHKSMAEYARAKSVIFKFQKPGDYLFANPRDSKVRQLARTAPSRVIFPRISAALKKITDKNLGSHYGPSVALAVAVAKHYGVPVSAIDKVLENFHGLEQRQQKIALIRGVTFINDTTATSPEAAMAALTRFRRIAGKNRLILIGGGQDKNLDFRRFIAEIREKADAVVFLPGTATRKIRIQISKFKNFPPTVEVKNMEEAVKSAYQVAKNGDIIILSPGAASFGLFLNEFDRGKQFLKAVKKLK